MIDTDKYEGHTRGPGRITTIVNPNDDHNRTLYVTIEFPDGEVYRGYVEKEGEEE
tara:strand:+ start:437 stop:601 length:165 start_codon:yes stop_codon:yes gene_type:complete